MKKNTPQNQKLLGVATMVLAAGILMSVSGLAQSDAKKKEIVADAKAAKKEFIKADGKMSGLFSKAYGYVIFPNVGKGAIGIGGASGNGVAYEKGAQVGIAKANPVEYRVSIGRASIPRSHLFLATLSLQISC